MRQDQAEVLAVTALGWLASNDELLPVFLGASGASLQDLKSRAEDPEFLGAVLDFLLMDDAWVMAFCDESGVPYDAPVRARAALIGGNAPVWT